MASAAGQAAFWALGSIVFGWLMVHDEVRADRGQPIPAAPEADARSTIPGT
jgi:hypothetical protein